MYHAWHLCKVIIKIDRRAATSTAFRQLKSILVDILVDTDLLLVIILPFILAAIGVGVLAENYAFAELRVIDE